MKVTKKFLIAALFSLLLNFLANAAAAEETIRVQGMGELKIIPEVASISFDITTKNKDSKKAQEMNATEANRIEKILKNDYKIEDKDISTQSYQVNPEYDWVDNKRIFKHFSAVHGRTVLVKNTKDAGKILDELYSASSSEQKSINIHGIYYLTLKKQQYEKDGIALAMDDALAKAEVMAKKAKRSIKKVLRISDTNSNWQNPGPIPMANAKSNAMMSVSMDKDSMSSTPVSSGEMSITTFLNVEYEMQ
ncbi:MAG: SIMPL domain-containing protein [Bacteriovoracaceae bacterium]|nr:SIMPL domain-containing protein [Bacteriovoracaceae bacterium]